MVSTMSTDQISPDRPGEAKDRTLMSKVRRRNRMITSCLECRRRKLKCDKESPCTNCTKFSRECVFLAPALDSVSQKKLNELKEKMGSLERTLEDDVGRRKSEAAKHRCKSSADLPGEGSETDEGPVPEDERGLQATPLATVDAIHEDGEVDDDILDLGFRVGKFRMTERLGGLYRPKLVEEMIFALVRDNKRGVEPEAPLTDDSDTFLEPGAAFIPPGSGFLFGDSGRPTNIVEHIPTKSAADLLVKRYFNNCHFLARVVHWPTFQTQYNTFWAFINSGLEPSASLQALVFSVFFQAIASMSNSEVDAVFGQTHRRVLLTFQSATETSLAKAHVLRTTKFETLQALILYLIPMCRGEISRAHSVLVGAAIRLGECFSLHRDPVDTFGHGPVEAQVRRLAWFQLCYLDFRTAEAQGPRPSIKREEYDTKMPWNLDDEDLLKLRTAPVQQVKESQWTDATLSKIRFECTEMHRIVWYDRLRLDEQKVSITHCLSKIESFRLAMEEKYAWLDLTITIQHYARILLDMLVLRMHIMILHKFHNATTTRIPDRLRQVLIGSGTEISEAAVRLDIDPKFDNYKWYNSALQQWHAAFLLLVEVFVFPNRKEADRIWSVADHVFQPDLTLSRVQKARSILGAVRDRAAAYRTLRKMREPMSMRNRLNTNLPARGRIRGTGMIMPAEMATGSQTGLEAPYMNDRNASIDTLQPSLAGSIPSANLQPPNPDTTTDEDRYGDWTVDHPATLFFAQSNTSVPEPSGSQASTRNSPPNHGIQHVSSISRAPHTNYQYNSQSFPPAQSPLSPSNQHYSPPPMYGNSALGLMSGVYMPRAGTNVASSQSGLSYDSRSPSVSNPTSPEPAVRGPFHTSNATSRLAMMGAIGSGQLLVPTYGAPPSMPSPQDMPMLDIDWSEWDKMFPLEINNGDLDLPTGGSNGRSPTRV